MGNDVHLIEMGERNALDVHPLGTDALVERVSAR